MNQLNRKIAIAAAGIAALWCAPVHADKTTLGVEWEMTGHGVDLTGATDVLTRDDPQYRAVATTLAAQTSANGTETLSVASTAGFSSAGMLLIGAEKIRYTGKTANTFTGITRGDAPIQHANNAAVRPADMEIKTRMLCTKKRVGRAGNEFPLVSLTYDMFWPRFRGNHHIRTLEVVSGPLAYDSAEWADAKKFMQAFYRELDARCALAPYTLASTSRLHAGINDVVTTLRVKPDASLFREKGAVKIDNEVITYTGNDGTNLTGLTRGANNTVAAAHLLDATVGSMQCTMSVADVEVALGNYFNVNRRGDDRDNELAPTTDCNGALGSHSPKNLWDTDAIKAGIKFVVPRRGDAIEAGIESANTQVSVGIDLEAYSTANAAEANLTTVFPTDDSAGKDAYNWFRTNQLASLRTGINPLTAEQRTFAQLYFAGLQAFLTYFNEEIREDDPDTFADAVGQHAITDDDWQLKMEFGLLPKAPLNQVYNAIVAADDTTEKAVFNTWTTKVAGAQITADATTFAVVDATLLPAAPVSIKIDNEVMRVTNIAVNTLTVTRAQSGTNAAIHAIDADLRSPDPIRNAAYFCAAGHVTDPDLRAKCRSLHDRFWLPHFVQHNRDPLNLEAIAYPIPVLTMADAKRRVVFEIRTMNPIIRSRTITTARGMNGLTLDWADTLADKLPASLRN